MDEILAEFIAETREMLAPLASEVVAWESDPSDRARLDTIFRFVHTVKGSCGFLNLPRLERLSHAAEGALSEVRSGDRVPDPALVSAVLAIIDRIGDMVEAIDAGEEYPEGGDDALIAALAPSAAPASNAAPSAAVTAGPRAPVRTIRMSIELLDRMMAGVSDMVLARNELSHRLREHHSEPPVDAAFERLSLSIAEIRDAVTRTRMQRIESLFAPLPRMIRDLSAELGKSVQLIVEGADVELDREMIEIIRDPISHMIRNSIDHGIEPPDARVAAGKPAMGLLRIAARQSGNQILIEVADDGRGIDADRLVSRALAAGIITAEQAETMPYGRRLALVFEPGLSTAKAVTAISGRGVGMDVVRANVDRIGGVIDIDSQVGVGTAFVLRAPLTLTIIPALTIASGGQRFAIPRAAIDEIIRAGSDAVRIERIAGGAEIARIRGRRLPVVDLATLMGTESAPGAERILVILRPAGGEAYAMSVDAALDHEELVVKAAAPAIMATGIYAGTSLPDTGRPMLLLDPSGLSKVAGIQDESAARVDRREGRREAAPDTAPTLLFRSIEGIDRAVRLAMVEHIEDVPHEAVRRSAGQLRLVHDGRLMPLFGVSDAPIVGSLRVLRLSDGANELAYAIGEVVDILALPLAFAPAALPGIVAGVMLVDGQQVELLDVHWLFAEAFAFASAVESRPLCLLRDGDNGWMRDVLRPLIESAGYRVAFPGETGEGDAAVIIESDGAPSSADASAGSVIRLRSARDAAGAGDDSIYRYDRKTLLAALQSRAAARAR